MTNVRNFAFAALLGVTALGFSMNANAEGGTQSSASGAGVSAGSSVGASGSTNGAGTASDAGVGGSAAIGGSVNTTGNQMGAGGTMNDGGSGSNDDYANSSTSSSQVLSTSDSSSSDTIPANGAKENTNRTTGAAETPASVTSTIIHYDALEASQISSIQSQLRSQGFRVGAIDGIWGPRTAAALREYQTQNNLNATGQLDSDTAAKLNLNQ